MAGPNKPSNQNNNQNDNKKKAPIGFLGIVLWAVVLVLLLNTLYELPCRIPVRLKCGTRNSASGWKPGMWTRWKWSPMATISL